MYDGGQNDRLTKVNCQQRPCGVEPQVKTQTLVMNYLRKVVHLFCIRCRFAGSKAYQ